MSINRPAIIGTGILVILAIPFVAMQFSEEVNWSAFDFGVAALLLLLLGTGIELVFRFTQKLGTRFLLLAAVVVLFLLVWAELAVGVFGTPFAGS